MSLVYNAIFNIITFIFVAMIIAEDKVDLVLTHFKLLDFRTKAT